MTRIPILFAGLLATASLIGHSVALAQMPPPTGGLAGSQPQAPIGADGSMMQDDAQKVEDFVDRAHILKGQDLAKARAAARESSTPLVRALELNCEITEAEPVGRGTAKVNGKSARLEIYEVACSNGLGYLLVSQTDAAPDATSCFSADTTHAEEVAAGRKSDMYCQLEGNKDVKGTATRLMAGAKITCATRTLRWLGASAASHTEYTEVVCDDGRGYLIRTAQAGSDVATTVMSCKEAADKGIKCRLTDAGPVAKPISMDRFKEALAANGFQCSVNQSRLVGQETTRKRYVVEFQCPEHPEGVVAFIPTGDNTNKFETMDCAHAVAQHVLCELTAQ
ncbi:MAG: hypothetical protein ACRETU_05405 [Steroidobacterales bacterium]